ncbi:MAG TPA: SpoIIE family protein phosphatase [Streptosporangiaceae bacterium]|nr:SpoIIE family protein phosphatase [Streptosporangiaceae bacterium]
MKGRKDLVASAAYLPEPAAVAAARKFVRDTLRSWLDTAPGAEADGGLVDDAVLLTSELVTNAVVHAGTQVQVTCKLAAGAVEVVVRDSHPARMVPGPAPDDTVPAERTGGRGLLLPSALAAAWGVSYGTDAKAVWFRMGLPGTPGGASGAEADPAALEAVVPASAWNVTGGAPEGASPASAPAGPASAGPVPASTMPLYNAAARSGYDKLLDQCVASARLIASADSAYALVADEDGDLGVRAASGLGPAAWLRTAPSVSTVPFMVDGQVTGVLAVAAARPGRFAEAEVRRLQQLADQMAPALERARLAELERARRARIGVLAEAGTLLAGPLDQDRILAVAGQVAVPRLAAWCAVLLSGPGGDLRLTVARHADESQAGALTWLLNRGCDLAPPAIAADARDGAARSWPLAALVPAQAPPGVADLAARGAWCFPLTTGGGPLGLLILGGPHGGPPSREVQRLAEDLAARIALALENSRLTARQQQASDALHAALVPPELPRIPGVELAFAHDLPGTDGSRSDLSRADAGGGDFCDVFPVTGRRWRFAIGEVCGTGPATLAVTSLARNALRILGAAGLDIPAVLDRLNQLILDERAPGTFLTLVHGEIVPGDPAGVSLACAGQPLPLVLRPRGRPETAAAPQPVLGVIEGQAFSAQDVTLDPGDLLLCVTDGVTRRRDGDRQLDDDDGLARLLAACTGLTADVVADKVHEEVRTFGGHPAVDGMAVLVIRAAT